MPFTPAQYRVVGTFAVGTFASGSADVAYAHLGLPQYETERLLTDRLLAAGVAVERGVELVDFSQDDDGVTARLRYPSGDPNRSSAVSTSRAYAGVRPHASRSAYAAGCLTFHQRTPPTWLCAPGPTPHQWSPRQ